VPLQQHDLYAYRPLELLIDEAPRDVPKEELSVSFPEWVPYR
jgi:hypothetical protein